MNVVVGEKGNGSESDSHGRQRGRTFSWALFEVSAMKGSSSTMEFERMYWSSGTTGLGFLMLVTQPEPPFEG